MTMNKFPCFRIWIIFGFIILSGICCVVTTATLQPIDSCPDDLVDEEYDDELEYDEVDEANASVLLDDMNAKYCEWAVAGYCYKYDLDECSKFGVFFPGVFLTSDMTYILKDEKPGILVLFGSWENEGNSTKPVPNTAINIRIFKKDPFNVRIHKIINTGEDGQALFEWIWGDTRSDWNNDWVLEYSHDNFTKEISLYSEVNDTQDFIDDTNVFTEYPNTTLDQ